MLGPQIKWDPTISAPPGLSIFDQPVKVQKGGQSQPMFPQNLVEGQYQTSSLQNLFYLTHFFSYKYCARHPSYPTLHTHHTSAFSHTFPSRTSFTFPLLNFFTTNVIRIDLSLSILSEIFTNIMRLARSSRVTNCTLMNSDLWGKE